MDALRNGCRRVLPCRRSLTTQAEPFTAAPPIHFTSNRDQFRRLRSDNDDENAILNQLRVIPASPSYFTASPRYTDDILQLHALLRKYSFLPVSPPGTTPRVSWRSCEQYRAQINEPVKQGRFSRLLLLVKRLNSIHEPLKPVEVTEALERFRKAVQPMLIEPKVITLDKYGRSRAVGRRKSSSAQCWLIEGEGEVLINGRTLTEYFSRIHDRESAIWALKATQRADKYNVWIKVAGGGTTGQAEAIQLGVAKALITQEPDLKPALRRAGVVSRDPRRVERKKPGKLKARKMPAWVKR